MLFGLLTVLAAIAPSPERDDLLDLIDDGDLVDQARIEQALYDPTIRKSGLRLLEQEIRDRRDRHLLRDRAQAIVAGVRFSFIADDTAAGSRSTVGLLFTLGISFDLLYADFRPSAVFPPILETIRQDHCERLLARPSVSGLGRADQIIRRIAERELLRALACDSHHEFEEVSWSR